MCTFYWTCIPVACSHRATKENKKTKDNREETTMTPMTTCFIIIGLIALMQVADDWGLWVRLERKYSKRNTETNR